MINYENHNLWLLDERLTFHTFAASDLPLNNYMDTQNDDRPDVVAFSDIDEETRVAKNVSVIELKKTQRKEFDESPIAQMLRMVKGIKEGQIVLQSNGRPLQVSISTRFYCYGVLDFTKKVKEFAADSDYIELNGELGYFNYHSQHKASIFLINFDKIVADAKKRHYAFFEKLGVK